MKRFVGLLLLAAAIAVVVYYSMRKSKIPGATQGPSSGPATVVRGLAGGEKAGFLDDPKVQEILRTKYGLKIEYEKRGSIEMARDDVSGQDFLWPSSQFAAEEL